MKLTESKLRKIVREELIKEGKDWLPNDLESAHRKLGGMVGKTIKWDIHAAYGVVVDILEGVNAHDEAAAVNKLLNRFIGK